MGANDPKRKSPFQVKTSIEAFFVRDQIRRGKKETFVV